jgi:thiol-disulfide isomerase/thioredoxin
LKALPLLLAALFVGATVAAVDTLARDRTMLQPLPNSVGHVSGDELGSLGRADAWLNSPPLTKAGLRGKVVLVQFWTYTCINWLRTEPYIRAWAEKYQHQGLVVIGVHAPEFAFEQDLDNVRRAVKDMNIGYPVAVDNGHAIWRAFDNNYWPALYFIDAQGRASQVRRGRLPGIGAGHSGAAGRGRQLRSPS